MSASWIELAAGGLALGGWFAVLFVLERMWPLRARRRPILRRLRVNLGLAALSFVAAATFVVPAAHATLGWTSARGFGLLGWLELPPLAAAALGILLLDLTFYWWHRANHRVPLLWRFHAAHHVDPDLDVSTGPRFHFGEMILSAGFRVAQIGLLGVSAGTLLLYELVFQAGTLFHHSNLRLPLRLERALSWLIVTPRMHGVHHSQVQAETESNFSVVFNVWDRLHRTLRLDVPQSEIRIGVPGYDEPGDDGFVAGALMPFRHQREHWRRAGGAVPDRDPKQEPGPRRRMAP